jgi:hypothetical protein
MSNQPDARPILDPTGGTGVPGNEGSPSAAEQLAAERDRLQAQVACLRAEVEGLKQTLAAAQEDARAKAALAEEWEAGWKELYALLPAELRIDLDELARVRENGGVLLSDTIGEIERDLGVCETSSGG